MPGYHDDRREWLETDGLGGFASGTVSGVRTRRYHALLLTATTPPTGRIVLINGWEVWIECGDKRFDLSAQHYAPDVIHPSGHQAIELFEREPWPTWTYRLPDGLRVRQELFCPHGESAFAARWTLLEPVEPETAVTLCVRPLMSGRDYHVLHHENADFRFDPDVDRTRFVWRPYDGIPAIGVHCNGDYAADPVWYRNFLYQEELARGLDASEDLASPGIFRIALNRGPAHWIAFADQGNGDTAGTPNPQTLFRKWERVESKRRKQFGDPLLRAADQYIVARGGDAPSTTSSPAVSTGKTLIAGYPWFADWGRDTFIAMRGLCLAAGRLVVAGEILRAWSQTVSEGMLPNRFPDRGDQPEYNAVDASLWYIVAAHEYLQAMKTAGKRLPAQARNALVRSIFEILSGYITGTRYGIRLDEDGLLTAGAPGVQLTWMDAKVGDWVVTPRIGKPVEIQALWLNALWIGDQLANGPLGARRKRLKDASRHSSELNLGGFFALGSESFAHRFWNEQNGYLNDVVDVGFKPGLIDASLRPNQIFAVGGLPLPLVDGERARRIVDVVEDRLLTPLGLRSLSSDHPDYKPHYGGGVWERDAAYHQGTAWPWLMGPFVEAWLRVHSHDDGAPDKARKQFIEPLLAHLDEHGLGHVCEVADAETPHRPGGCPFQAWSLGELLRLRGILQGNKNRAQSAGGSPSRRSGRRIRKQAAPR